MGWFITIKLNLVDWKYYIYLHYSHPLEYNKKYCVQIGTFTLIISAYSVVKVYKDKDYKRYLREMKPNVIHR